VRNNPQAVIALLGLPSLVFPVSGMPLGWPADAPLVRPRLATAVILHLEGYDASDEERLLEDYDRAMAQTGIYAGRQVAVSGPMEEGVDYGWRAPPV
jgi:hypothetical protein